MTSAQSATGRASSLATCSFKPWLVGHEPVANLRFSDPFLPATAHFKFDEGGIVFGAGAEFQLHPGIRAEAR